MEASGMSDFMFGVLIVLAAGLSALIGVGLWIAAMVIT
jgi:hypothetical protein